MLFRFRFSLSIGALQCEHYSARVIKDRFLNRRICMLFTRTYFTFSAQLALFVTFMLLCSCSKNEGTAPTSPPSVKQEFLKTSAVLSVIAADELPDSSESGQKHAQGSKTDKTATSEKQKYFQVEMNRSGTGVAYLARVGDKVRVVHNGKPGKLYKEIDGTTLVVSLDGKHVGYGASNDSSLGAGSSSSSSAKWLLVHDDKEEGPFDSLGPPAFSPDGRHIAFECKMGERWKMFIDDKAYGDAFSYIDKPVFSGDSQLLLFGETGEANRPPRIVISDLTYQKLRIIDQSGGPVAFNTALSRVAAMQESGKQKRMVEFDFSLSGSLKGGELYDEVFSPLFSADGTALAYLGKRRGATYLVLAGKEEKLPAGEYPSPLAFRPDNKGAGIPVVGKDGTYLFQAFGSGGASPNRYKEVGDVVYSSDGRNHAYVAIRNEQFLIVANGKDGPVYDRVIAPQFSPDSKYLVYRARQNNKRFVVVADTTGKVIREHPRYERVFETTFTPDGGSVAYGAVDGKKIFWKVEKL